VTLPGTLADILAMGRDALHAIVRLYMPVLGLDKWEITARWVEAEDAGGGELVAGYCEPNPTYKHAVIGVAWPPVGDLEETVVHELVHCQTARLAFLAGAAPGTWAREEWEDVAEQTARGMVAVRRHGERSPVVLSRVFRSKWAALRRDRMDPVKLAELAMKAGEMAAREDVPEDVRQLLAEFVAALAGGGGEPEAPAAAETDPSAPQPPMATDDPDKVPGYMRVAMAQIKELSATVARLSSAPQSRTPAVSAELAEARRLSVETFLSTKSGILSADAERELVQRADIKLARLWVADAERRPVQRSGAKAPGVDEASAVKLSPEQIKAARRHRLTDEQMMASVRRQSDRKAALGRGGN
jgi:hypothetical protein